MSLSNPGNYRVNLNDVGIMRAQDFIEISLDPDKGTTPGLRLSMKVASGPGMTGRSRVPS
jgi:hypothetical protein